MDSEKQNRQEKVLAIIKDYTNEYLKNPEAMSAGLQAADVAGRLDLDRSNVSRELNNLYKSGHLIKQLGKPTLYLHRLSMLKAYPQAFFPTTIPKGKQISDYLEDSYTDARVSGPAGSAAGSGGAGLPSEQDLPIGLNGSLQDAFTQASAAIMYPPHGLHILITGSVGTGKLRFARTLYEYGIRHHYLPEDAPFVTCDCREYQTSPQALLIQLFGEGRNTKNRSRRGLLEKAAGGILCLDGIQSISPMLQKRLSKLLENRIYSRIGEADTERLSSALIIALASDASDLSALHTLSRNFPVHVTLPDLDRRGKRELYEYIALFFQQQSSATGISFCVDKNVIAQLLCASYPGNVSELMGTVKAICSLAFRDHVTTDSNNSVIAVTANHLPSGLSGRITSDSCQVSDISRFMSGLTGSTVTFSPGTAYSPDSLSRTDRSPLHGPDAPAGSHPCGIPLFAVLHGDGIAERLADFVNQEWGAGLMTGLSFGSYPSLRELTQALADLARLQDRGNGILIFADMDPLLGLHEPIKKMTGIEAETVAAWNFTTLFSLCRRAADTTDSVHDFVSHSLPPLPEQCDNNYIRYVSHELLAPSLTFLNPDKAVTILLDTLDKILGDLSLPYSDETALRFLFHCSHMLERLIREKPLKYDRLKSFTSLHPDVFASLERQMQYPAQSFGVVIPASELAYIAEIFVS